MKEGMSASINKALENQNLAGILDRWNYPATRAKAFEGVDFEALRTTIAEIKGEAAGHLRELALTFKKNAEANGIKVFIANSPEAAREYIANLCKEKGVKKSSNQNQWQPKRFISTTFWMSLASSPMRLTLVSGFASLRIKHRLIWLCLPFT